MEKLNPNTRPLHYRDTHDNRQADKARQHEEDIQRLDRRPAEKGGRGTD